MVRTYLECDGEVQVSRQPYDYETDGLGEHPILPPNVRDLRRRVNNGTDITPRPVKFPKLIGLALFVAGVITGAWAMILADVLARIARLL